MQNVKCRSKTNKQNKIKTKYHDKKKTNLTLETKKNKKQNNPNINEYQKNVGSAQQNARIVKHFFVWKLH